MIVRYFDIVGVTLLPPEADAPLVVDADAMLASTVTREPFQPVSRRDTQIVQPFGDIKLNQLAPGQAM